MLQAIDARAEVVASAPEPRRHSARRKLQRFGDLRHGQVVDFVQDEHDAQLDGHAVEDQVEQGARLFLLVEIFGVPCGVDEARQLFVAGFAAPGARPTHTERHAISGAEQERALLKELPVSVRASVSALAPLANGEHVVAALPLALTLR